jgi:DNA ligase-1
MKRFAELMDRLTYEHSRNNKLRLMTDYFRTTPDPERGYALAALTGSLSFQHAKPGTIRALIAERTDPVLFGLSWDYVGDLSETVALMWPAPKRGKQSVSDEASRAVSPSPSPFAGEGRGGGWKLDAQSRSIPTPNLSPQGAGEPPLRDSLTPSASLTSSAAPTLSQVVTTLWSLGKAELPAQLARWLDTLGETGRWALLKLVTGELRIGVSARLAKTAVAALGGKEPLEIELVWSALAPPYLELFAWLEGRAEKPVARDPAPFRPVMLAHALEEPDLAALDPADYLGEWKWDGIRVQASAGTDEDGNRVTRLYSRTGEDISRSFPDLLESLSLDGALDGELLILREGRVQSFNVLQQRLNRKAVTPKMLSEFPAHLRAYDLLVEGADDLRERPFAERRERLETFIARLDHSRIDISPLVPFDTWEELIAARADPAVAGAGVDAEAVEGVMLKRRESPYRPGRPKGQWWKWKRDPLIVDAVLMYAARGSGKRSSYYSDYTFGVWTEEENGETLVPVGKAYFGFTDEELLKIDRFVRRNTVERFGPVREVVHDADQGLVLEVAFEGLQRSTRHKSGLAMRFPRISRLRWDKPPREADRLETLERMLRRIEDGRASASEVSNA